MNELNWVQIGMIVLIIGISILALMNCATPSSRLEHCELTIRHLQSELDTCKDESFEELVK